MTDGLSTLYRDLLGYDCVDRIVLNAYFRMGHDPGGFRVWWRALSGSDETLENAYLMRLAGRFSRRLRGYAKAHDIPVIDCPAGQRKHDLAEEYLAKTRVTQGLFLVLVGRAQAPVWDVSAKHHIERKKPMPYVNHKSFHILDPDWGHLTIKISGHPPFPGSKTGSKCIRVARRKSLAVGRPRSTCWRSVAISRPLELAQPMKAGRLFSSLVAPSPFITPRLVSTTQPTTPIGASLSRRSCLRCILIFGWSSIRLSRAALPTEAPRTPLDVLAILLPRV